MSTDGSSPGPAAEPTDPAAEDWEFVAPTGPPRVDLPPPPASTPFDMDFIGRALSKMFGGPSSDASTSNCAPPTLDEPAARRRRSFPPLPRPRTALARSPLPPPPPPLPPGVVPVDAAGGTTGAVADGPPAAATTERVRDERPQLVTELLGADGRLFQFAPPKAAPTDVDRRRGVRVALRTLLRQRRRMVLSIVAVALGVGYLAGALSLLQRVGAGLAEQAGANSERADLVVEGTIADDGPLQQVRKLVPDSIVELAAGVDGVAAVEPRLESKSTLILDRSGAPVVGLGLTERPLGANFPEESALSPYRFVGKGAPPEGPDQVVLDRRSAEVADVEVGGTVLIAGKVGLHSYTVTGIVEQASGELPAGSSLALFDTDAARTLFELGPDDNAIAIAVDEGADIDAVADRLRRIVPPGSEVSTGAEYAEHRQASFEKSFTLIRALLVGFAALALVVGAFTVANSMALLFDHRRRGFAMLRLLGASPAQLVTAAGGESLLGGMLAGAVGLGLGLGVGAAIEALIRSMGTPLPTAGPLVTWWIPVLAVTIGAAVTTSTALSPARQAARTPPVHAVTGADDRPADRPRRVTLLRWLATVAILAGASAVLAAAFGATSAVGLAAAVGAAVGVVLVVLPQALSGVVGLATSLLLGRSVALRRMSALRSRQARTRAASTTAALLLSSAVVTGLTVLSSSFLESIDGQITSAVTADLVVDSATFATGGLAADLVPALRTEAGVDAVTGWRVGAAYVGSTLWRSAGIDGAALFAVLDLDVEGTVPTVAGADDVVISRELADSAGLAVGDIVPVQFQNAAVVPLRVAAVFRSDVRILFGDLIVDTSVMTANLPQSIDVMAFVKLEPDAPASTRAAIETTARKYGAANVLTPDDLVSERAELLRGFARVIQWMLAFSVVLALIGVANTLQLGVNERRRELGLIRAVGATKHQVLRLVMAEAGALSLIGTFIGMAVGAVAAWLTVRGLSDFGLDRFVAPVGTLAAIAAVSVGLGLGAAILPAWRATRIPLLDAISDGGEPHRRRRRRPTTPTSDEVDHGDPEDRTANVGWSDADLIVDGFPTQHEVTMALRCYNCGYEPGSGETCIACGAVQELTSVGLFTSRPDPLVVEPDAEVLAPLAPQFQAEPTADIVDAAVVEDGIVVEPTVPPVATVGVEDVARPHQPLFEGRPSPSVAHDPMKSPFGQHERTPWAAPVVEAPAPTPTTPGPAAGVFSAGTRNGSSQAADAPGPQPTAGPPPAFARAVAGGDAAYTTAGAGTVPPPPPVAPPIPDAHGLASAIGRLSGAAQQNGRVPFSIVGALMGLHELVRSAVAGVSLGMPTAVVVTDRRVLIVSDHGYVPVVETFELGPSLGVHGRHVNDLASLTFTEGERLITVDQIPDVGIAVELANAARHPTPGGEF